MFALQTLEKRKAARRLNRMYFVPDSSACQPILCPCVAVVSVVRLWALMMRNLWARSLMECTECWRAQIWSCWRCRLPAEHASKALTFNFLPVCYTHTASGAGEYTPDRALLTVIDEGKLVDEDWAPSAFWKLRNVDGAVFSPRCENTFLDSTGGAAAEHGRNMTADKHFRCTLPAVIHTS